MSFNYQSTPVEIRNKTMALVKDELAAVGVEVNIDQMPGQAFFGRYGPLVQGTFDLAEYAGQDSGVDAVTKFGSKFIPNQANNFSGQNFSRYSNATADQLIGAGSYLVFAGTTWFVYVRTEVTERVPSWASA